LPPELLIATLLLPFDRLETLVTTPVNSDPLPRKYVPDTLPVALTLLDAIRFAAEILPVDVNDPLVGKVVLPVFANVQAYVVAPPTVSSVIPVVKTSMLEPLPL
jgi:hypothetical protein